MAGHDFAMETIEKAIKINSASISLVWFPVFKEVRKKNRFKELIREMGLVDYWNEYGWPDTGICRPVDNDDFECD